MIEKEITKNIYNLINNLKDLYNRKQMNLSFAEGKNILISCLENKIRIKYLIIDKNHKYSFYELISGFFSNAGNNIDFEIYYTDEKTLSKLSTTRTSYQCITIFEMPKIVKQIDDFENNITDSILEYLKKERYIALIYQISDPGNLGTIIRTSLGFNQKRIILTQPHCEPLSPKVVRSTSGSIFKMEKIYSIKNGFESSFITRLKDNKVKVFFAYSRKNESEKINFSNLFPGIIIFGNEGRGIPEKMFALNDFTISIPQSLEIESYNLSISHAIISYILYKEKK